MQRMMILLVIFMSGSLAAMNHEGAWDEYGNYVGTQHQVPVPQMMMMPQLVYMPVYVDQYGQAMMQPPMMHQPIVPYQLAMGQQFGMMPALFPQVYTQPPRIEPFSDQWAAPAPVESVEAPSSELVVQSNDCDTPSTPPLQPASSSSSTTSTSSASTTPAVVSEKPTLALDSTIATDDDDKEVAAITQHMERASIDDQSNTAAPVAPVVHWADMQDSPSPKNMMPADENQMRSAQSSPSSASTSSAVSTSAMPTDKAKPTIISYAQAVMQKSSTSAPRSVASSVSASASHKSKKTVNERLQDALAEMSTCKASNRVPQIVQNKFDWINTLQHESDRTSEWERLITLFEKSGLLSVPVQATDHANSLMYLADTLAQNAEKMDKKLSVRKRFARLAMQCVDRASEQLPAHLVAQASDISSVAAGLVPASKKEAQDQTDIPEDEFYKGYTLATDKVKSSPKKAPQARSHATVAKVAPQPAPAKQTKKAPAKKKVAPQPHVAQRVQEPKQEKKSEPAVQKNDEQLMQKRIEALLTGNRKKFKEGLSLLEQVAEGKIADVDPAYQMKAIRRVADIYLYGYVPDTSETPFVEQDLGRASYYMHKAYDSDNNVSALFNMLLIEFEQGRQKVGEYSDRLEAHADADDSMKRSARILRAAAQLMNDEQGQLAGDAFVTFKKVHDTFSFNQPMTSVTNILPKSFWEWAYAHIPVWKQQLEYEVGDSDGKTELSAAQELYKEVCSEWLYLVGRLYIDGCLEGSERLNQQNHHAINWIQSAANSGNPRAQLYLAAPIGNSKVALCVYDRMYYLRSALSSDWPRSSAEREHTERVCGEYARQGFLAPLTDYLCLRKNAQKLDDALETLKDNFPVIRIADGSIKTFVVAQESGLIDELQKRASDSWVVRAILSALEISGCRDVKMPVSAATIARVDNALARIQEDVKDHPQLKSLVAAYYSTRAFVTKRISSEVSYGTLDQGIQLMKQVYQDYEESIARGDSFGKFTYGALLLKTNIALIQKASGAVELYPKGLALLKELAEGQDAEYKTAVLELLTNHYAEQQDWDRMDHYLKMSRQHALSLYNHERVKSLEKIANTLQAKRKPGLKKKDAQKVAKQVLVTRQVQSAQNGEIIQNLKRADEYVSLALTKARTRPFEALQDLRTMNAFQIQPHLNGNPRMIALCYMVLDDLNEAAADPALVKESARAVFLKTLDPFYHTMGQASISYQERASKPDYKQNKFENLIRAYLEAYHLRERVAVYITATRAGETAQTTSGPLQVDQVSNMMSLWSPDQQDEYLQICKDDVVKKREVYQVALAQEAADLKAALENSKVL